MRRPPDRPPNSRRTLIDERRLAGEGGGGKSLACGVLAVGSAAPSSPSLESSLPESTRSRRVATGVPGALVATLVAALPVVAASASWDVAAAFVGMGPSVSMPLARPGR